LSIVGRRGSSESGWSWSRPPSGRRRPPPAPPLLPLAGGGLIALLVALALLVVWLTDSDNNSPADAASTATPPPTATTAPPSTPSPAATAPPTAVPTPSATPPSLPPSPTPTPVPDIQGALFRLAAWNGKAWQFNPTLEGAAYREGLAVPFLLRIDRAIPGTTYALTIRYDCRGFDFLTTYDRDAGSEPALASGGPGSPIVDSAATIPDDPATPADDREAGSISLWGGSLRRVDATLPSTACTGVKSLPLGLTAAADTVFLMWAAQLSDTASDGGVPLRLAVRVPGVGELIIEIDPARVGPAQP
jgi:hypothetical protein